MLFRPPWATDWIMRNLRRRTNLGWDLLASYFRVVSTFDLPPLQLRGASTREHRSTCEQHTGWKPMLCYIELPDVERSPRAIPGAIAVHQQPRRCPRESICGKSHPWRGSSAAPPRDGVNVAKHRLPACVPFTQVSGAALAGCGLTRLGAPSDGLSPALIKEARTAGKWSARLPQARLWG
jgi:hypothetical protein